MPSPDARGLWRLKTASQTSCRSQWRPLQHRLVTPAIAMAFPWEFQDSQSSAAAASVTGRRRFLNAFPRGEAEGRCRCRMAQSATTTTITSRISSMDFRRRTIRAKWETGVVAAPGRAPIRTGTRDERRREPAAEADAPRLDSQPVACCRWPPVQRRGIRCAGAVRPPRTAARVAASAANFDPRRAAAGRGVRSARFGRTAQQLVADRACRDWR